MVDEDDIYALNSNPERFDKCEKCDGTGLDLSYFDKMKHVVTRNEIPACEVCEGWGEIEPEMSVYVKCILKKEAE